MLFVWSGLLALFINPADTRAMISFYLRRADDLQSFPSTPPQGFILWGTHLLTSEKETLFSSAAFFLFVEIWALESNKAGSTTLGSRVTLGSLHCL